jgi:hypothetical protein
MLSQFPLSVTLRGDMPLPERERPTRPLKARSNPAELVNRRTLERGMVRFCIQLLRYSQIETFQSFLLEKPTSDRAP